MPSRYALANVTHVIIEKTIIPDMKPRSPVGHANYIIGRYQLQKFRGMYESSHAFSIPACIGRLGRHLPATVKVPLACLHEISTKHAIKYVS